MDYGVQGIVTMVILVSTYALVVVPYWTHTDFDVRSALPRLVMRKYWKFRYLQSKVLIVLFVLTVLAVPIVTLAVIWTRP
jgi:hypothetical protein